MVTALVQDGVRFTAQHNQAAADYYKTQAAAAAKAVAATRSQATQYLGQHPNATANDPNLSALTTAEQAASAQLTQANANLSAALSTNAGNPVRVIDAATRPVGPTSGKSKQLVGILGGLLAGVLISFLGTVALTRGKSGPWDEALASGEASSEAGLISVGQAAGSGGAGRTAGGGQHNLSGTASRRRLSLAANTTAPSGAHGEEPNSHGIGDS
jgi:hypothetical protein